MLALSSRNKWLLALLALVSANGATFSLVDFNSLFSSLPSLGGGFSSQLIDVNNYNFDSSKLSLEGTRASDFSVGKLDSTYSPSISLENQLSDTLVKETKTVDSNIQTTVALTHKEITKEVKVMDVGDRSNEKLREELEKLIGKDPLLRSAISKVTEYRNSLSSSSGAQGSRRSKRSAPSPSKPTTFQKLSQEERKALKSFLESFSRLEREKPGLSKELKKAAEEGNSELDLEARNFSTALRNLRRLDWENSELQLTHVHKDPIKSKNRKELKEPPTEKNFYGWYEWSQTPYTTFFSNQEEWLEKMRQLSRSKQDLERYLEKQRPCGVILMGLGSKVINWCVKDKHKYENRISSSHGELELHIASWLLSQMQI